MSTQLALLTGRCPRCGNSGLFEQFISYKQHCEACELEISSMDVGDGPVFFVILIVGMLIAGLATYVEISYSPSLMMHALLWIPATLIATILCLRLARSALIYTIYHHKHTHD